MIRSVRLGCYWRQLMEDETLKKLFIRDYFYLRLNQRNRLLTGYRVRRIVINGAAEPITFEQRAQR